MDLEKVLTAVGKEDLKIFTYELMSGKEALVDSFLSVNHPTRVQLVALLAAALGREKLLMATAMTIGPTAAAALLDSVVFAIAVGAGIQDKLSKEAAKVE